jgi:hypothetical protein
MGQYLWEDCDTFPCKAPGAKEPVFGEHIPNQDRTEIYTVTIEATALLYFDHLALSKHSLKQRGKTIFLQLAGRAMATKVKRKETA